MKLRYKLAKISSQFLRCYAKMCTSQFVCSELSVPFIVASVIDDKLIQYADLSFSQMLAMARHCLTKLHIVSLLSKFNVLFVIYFELDNGTSRLVLSCT